MIRLSCLLVLVCALPLLAVAQSPSLYQTDFSIEEFRARRAKVFDAIGGNAMAIVQGAPSVNGFKVFRQSNEFYYLCGLETPHSYLLLDGRTRKVTLYLPHRDEARERNEGKLLTFEDAELVKKLTGVDTVAAVELMGRDWIWTLFKAPPPVLYTPFSPAEVGADSRDELLGGMAGTIADPWDGRPSREGHFVQLIRSRYPQFEVRDLSPVLDRMRIIKSPREIELIRRASQLAGLGLVEAMRSTQPGVMEYQLDAAARYIFQINGARREGYSSITAGGTNAWMGHYFRNESELKDGDLVLMDYAPDYRYYTSDVARMWPVNGRYTEAQRQLCEFILAYRNALLKRIRPGALPAQIMDEAAREMGEYLNKNRFSQPQYERAAREALKFRGHLSHPVGMAVHDVGSYKDGPLKVGMVFSVDPMLWVPEEKLYVRIEDVVAVTENGVENFTDFIPARLEDIENAIREEGVLQKRPPSPPPARLKI
ncbi:MAG TPA: Xaa-Pro aminopeptidase [Pyrinomonadaceae bacterium]|nr:Xaa-Pro aminopeptidase [Pyrinomonadaceae bacterium]